jgi:hypothetical protein
MRMRAGGRAGVRACVRVCVCVCVCVYIHTYAPGIKLKVQPCQVHLLVPELVMLLAKGRRIW